MTTMSDCLKRIRQYTERLWYNSPVKKLWKRINTWLRNKNAVLGAWASLLQIIIFPAIIITVFVAYFQLKDYIAKPDLLLKFSNPESLTYRIVNTKNVLAERPLYWINVIDIDGSPMSTVPFPAQEISYIRGNEIKGPNAFGNIYGKKGHRYFGFAGISCKNCEKTRRYWLYFIHGSTTGAWYREMSPDENQGILVNAVELAKNPDKYLAELLPKQKRFPIE